MIPMTDCKSSAIAAHGYDPATRTLAVRSADDKAD